MTPWWITSRELSHTTKMDWSLLTGHRSAVTLEGDFISDFIMNFIIIIISGDIRADPFKTN